jgi:soluble lytic murein transglycosylase-like protein
MEMIRSWKVVAISFAWNFIMLAVLTFMFMCVQDLSRDRERMLAQRIAVLDVESHIQERMPWLDEVTRRGYAEMIVDAATEFKKPPLVVAEVAISESALNDKAIGDGGHSVGIMQVQPRWWVGKVPFIKTADDLRDARTNIRAGTWILKHYEQVCGEDVESYLACYNGGEGRPEPAKQYAKRLAAKIRA